jgi:tripeptide aminopeptidase
MFEGYKFTASERFMRYVQVDTQSDPQSSSHPTTEKQKDLSRILVQELQAMGIGDAEMDEFGYVYATIPENTTKKVPVICFCSHVDTAPDASGTGVKPLLHPNYNGQPIILPDDPGIVISSTDFPYLEKLKGHNIITASGKTLLGSDDKAGVAEIMDAANFFVTHPEVKHGRIRIVFTPDEEVGKGTAKIDMEKLAANFGYTLDGGEAGSLEDETFSADGVKILIHGVITHPGYAKDKMVNAMKIAGEILAALPKELSPEATEKREGFIHPTGVSGISEKCTLEFIVRDFVTDGLKEKEALLNDIAKKVVDKYPGAAYEFIVSEQYRNMKEVLDKHPQVVDYAKQAIRRSGFKEIRMESIRGGTDGSRLSFMGLPCPNLFTGMHAIHSKKEFVSVQDMNRAVETIVHLATIWEENSSVEQ